MLELTYLPSGTEHLDRPTFTIHEFLHLDRFKFMNTRRGSGTNYFAVFAAVGNLFAN